jgi:two-component system, LytTR family, sensor kinase
MLKWRSAIEWKYFRFELLFFISYYLMFPIFSSFEFTAVEHSFVELSRESFFRAIINNLVYSPANMFAGIVYYVLVSRSLVTKKLLRFILYTVLFLIGLVLYKKLVYLAVSNIHWLPAKLVSDAARLAKQNRFHFSIVYMCREFLCIVALAWFIYSAKQDDNMRILKEQQLLTELSYLKAQLHPHFFFNTINNIYSLALKRSADTAPLVAKLADMMRYILYEAEQPKVPLQKEIQFLTNYIDAEKIRQHNNNSISFDVQGVQPHTMIEPLLLLPFIENAFKHGLHEETGNGFVQVVICETNNELNLQVNNSKPQPVKEIPKGIGVQNATRRLNLLYPGRYVMNIKEDANTFHLNLSLPTNDQMHYN